MSERLTISGSALACFDASKRKSLRVPKARTTLSVRGASASARTWMLISHPCPPRPTRRLFDAPVFARAKLRSKAASAFYMDEPTGQGYVAGKSRAHARIRQG